jgi:hypothetical protein
MTRRHAFHFTAGVSLVLCAACAAAWAEAPWGFDREDQRRLIVGGDAYFLASRAGGLRFVRQRATSSGPGPETANPGRLGFWQIGTWQGHGAILLATRFGPAEPDHAFLGFGWGRAQYRKTTDFIRANGREFSRYTLDYAVVAVPYWALMLATAAVPALWLRDHLRRRRRLRRGHCPACGYDLRATPGRCPECGRGAQAPQEIVAAPPAAR